MLFSLHNGIMYEKYLNFRYVDGYFAISEVATEFHQVFIMQQLLNIAGFMDLSDEVGR